MQSCFYDQCAQGESAYHTIATWKVCSERWHTQRKFRNQQTALGKLMREIAIAGGIDLVQSGRHDSDAGCFRAQSSAMSSRIDATSADLDADPGAAADAVAEAGRDLAAALRAMPR